MSSRQHLRRMIRAAAGAALACTLVLLGAGTSAARPAYFDQFKSNYAIAEGSNLDACGVCHYRWLGTGARNPYGSTVEQQLYLGKSVIQSLTAVEGMDPDEDGYTSADEIITYMTLPGYNCDNFVSATGAPTGYDTYITPLVATCLDPLDIRTTPTSLGALISVGEIRVMELTVLNNGSTDALEISSYELLPGAPASLTLSGPAVPLSIPVGSSVVIDVIFTPTSAMFSNSTLRISSNDPDEANYDVPITVFAAEDPTAPGAQRAPCFAAITKAMARYAKLQLRQWGDCYLNELAGRACDTGTRTLKLARAAAKLAAVIGGDKDKSCAAAGLSVATLGFPGTCAAGCEDISLGGISEIPTCLACMQDRVMEGMLRDAAGTAPPDLPPNVITDSDAFDCQKRIVRALQKGLLSITAELAQCELAAMLADQAGGTCQSDQSAALAAIRATIDASVDQCTSTADLLGCRFEGMSPDPACLGLSAESLSADLILAMFALYE